MFNLRLPARAGTVTGWRRLVVAALLVSWASTAAALEIPVPAERYADPDPAGSVYPDLDHTDETIEASLNSAIRRNRDNPVPLAQRGLLHFLQGARSRGQRDYDRAFSVGDAEGPERRYAHWSYGWALYGTGDHAGALAQWMTAHRLHGGDPQWVPATYALALWSIGAREVAVDFFDRAARGQPGLWGSAAAVDATTAGWRPNERLVMQSLYNAWSAP